MDCPICQHTGIEDGTQRCPKCGSDLEAFNYLSKIDSHTKKQRKTIWLLGFVSFIFLIGFIITFSSIEGTPEKDSDVNKQLELLKNENEQLQTTINDLDQQLKAVKDDISKQQSENKETGEEIASEPATLTKEGNISDYYVVKQGETLSYIAEKMLGDANKYPKIANENNISDPNFIVVGQELNITNN